MNYFATLVYGNSYSVGNEEFEANKEKPVSAELAEYLKTCGEKVLVAQGSGYAVKVINRFQIREVEPTVEEVVKKEIANAPDKLTVSKPGRKPAN